MDSYDNDYLFLDDDLFMKEEENESVQSDFAGSDRPTL